MSTADARPVGLLSGAASLMNPDPGPEVWVIIHLLPGCGGISLSAGTQPHDFALSICFSICL